MGVLRVLIDGVWVDIGGASDEVVVGPNDPILLTPTAELWYDTDATNVASVPLASGRNLLDNGQMAIKQRGTTATAVSGVQWLADRWAVANVGVGAVNLVYGAMASFFASPPAGRPRPANVQYIQVTTAEAGGALAAGDYTQWAQNLEGQFLQHLNWGTADALPLTYSFDIYSTIATTYIVELYRPETAVRSISRLLTVPAGWSTQVVTFPGDITTAITNDNVARLQIAINLVGGSTYTSGTLQTSWGATVVANRWPGMSNAIQATIGNTVAITNAQLEIGSQATPYEVRRYDDEMQHCLRYFFETPKGLYTNVPSAGVTTTATQAYVQVFLPVRMRAVPTPSYVGAMRLIDQFGASGLVVSALSDAGAGQSNLDVLYLGVTIAGATGGRFVALQGANDANAAFRASAEI